MIGRRLALRALLGAPVAAKAVMASDVKALMDAPRPTAIDEAMPSPVGASDSVLGKLLRRRIEAERDRVSDREAARQALAQGFAPAWATTPKSWSRAFREHAIESASSTQSRDLDRLLWGDAIDYSSPASVLKAAKILGVSLDD